jgi:isopenicillin N synthase-like dioxygenase
LSTPQPDLDRDPVASGTGPGREVPVIDIGPLVAARDAAGAGNVAAEIAAACREWGFFQVANHGLDDGPRGDLLADARRQMEAFFGLPRAAKEAILRSRENPWGYYNNELTKNQRDRKEVFDFTREDSDEIYRAANRWPQLAGFRSTMLAWLDACERLSHRLLEAFCVGLDLAPDTLAPSFAPRHTGFVRLNYYPVEDPLAGSTALHLPVADLGVHHHTDAGALTVLLQDDVGGLQVHRDGCWYDVAPVPGALVINTGDMMQVWSNDIYRAAMHRVLAMNSQDRFSIPFFFNPAAATLVEPLPSTVGGSRPARNRALDWSEFRARRTEGDYADYGAEVQISQYRI